MAGTMKMDALSSDPPSDGMLIFYETAPTLKRLAMFKAAAEIISLKIIPVFINVLDMADQLYPLYTSNYQFRWRVQVHGKKWFELYGEFTKHLPIPHKFRFEISKLIMSMISRLYSWGKCHSKYISEFKNCSSSEFLSNFVWRRDGSIEIDYPSTAKNLIYGGKICDQERLKMMCLYCLEFDLKNAFESFDWVRSYMEEPQFQDDFDYGMYWHCRLTGRKPIVPYNYPGSYERYLLQCSETFNSIAVGFCVDKLNEQELIHYFCNEMTNWPSLYTKFLMMRLPADLQKKVLELITLPIMIQFVSHKYTDFALQFWNHVKNSIPKEEFAEMMETLLLGDINFYYEFEYPDWMEDLIINIWENTPPRLKKFVFKYQDGSIIYNWNRWFESYTPPSFSHTFPRDDTALLLILDDADSKFKKQFWLQEWSNLMINSRPAFLRRFMFSCMSDLLEIREFERKILTSDAMIEYFLSFFRKFDMTMIVQLNEFFDVLGSDSKLRSETKTRLCDQLAEIPEVFDREPTSFADDRELLHSLAEFFLEVDQNNKMNLICRLFDILSTRRFLLSLNLSFVCDNILKVAESICDPEHMQIILKKAPSEDEFNEDFIWKMLQGCVDEFSME